ncbi:MAG TPA: flagellar regulator YcgR PilZN domain-containing protein [Methylophilaceae bacterium]|nr:flagellar regulator YcgR PilZN domain-containing protein [Methylophilaceae bacterium]
MSKEQARSAAKPPIFGEEGQQLVEAQEEIIELLNAMMLSSTPCAAYVEEGDQFLVCSIVGLEPAQGQLYLRYDAETPMLERLTASKSLCYVASHEDAKVQFLSPQPQSVTFRAYPALRIPIPKMLWRLQRREHPRQNVERGQVRIVLNFAGVGSVETEAADISVGGIGIIHYHPQLRLEPGLVLEDCEIRIAEQAPIKVKMRIQHSTPIQFPDGEIVKRSGCQFLDLEPATAKALAAGLNKLKNAR